MIFEMKSNFKAVWKHFSASVWGLMNIFATSLQILTVWTRGPYGELSLTSRLCQRMRIMANSIFGMLHVNHPDLHLAVKLASLCWVATLATAAGCPSKLPERCEKTNRRDCAWMLLKRSAYSALLSDLDDFFHERKNSSWHLAV